MVVRCKVAPCFPASSADPRTSSASGDIGDAIRVGTRTCEHRHRDRLRVRGTHGSLVAVAGGQLSLSSRDVRTPPGLEPRSAGVEVPRHGQVPRLLERAWRTGRRGTLCFQGRTEMPEIAPSTRRLYLSRNARRAVDPGGRFPPGCRPPRPRSSPGSRSRRRRSGRAPGS